MKVCLGLVCSVLCWATFAGEALGQTVTFFPTGGQQTFAVPGGVSTVNVVAVGARGGGDGLGVPGGFGARAAAHLSVSAGQVLYVEVGGNGGSGPGSGAGGFNGGGAGGSGSGGGGGASDLRTLPISDSGSLASRLIVAGGGGGGAAGAGGGDAGADGAGAGAGKAGSQTAGGAGGDAPSETGALPGDKGASGSGGAGVGTDIGGAGGGGGLFGGGGGSGCTSPMGQMGYCNDPTTFPGGNGGGGSSGFASGASDASLGHDTSGVSSIAITYTGPPPAKPPAPPSAALIGKSLLSQLVPHGKAARISAIRKHHGYTFKFNALLAGTATISWYQMRRVHLPHAHAAIKQMLVATGSHRFTAAGRGKLAIHLTRKGRGVFKHAKHLKLTAKGKFKPSGAAISRQRTFTLKH